MAGHTPTPWFVPKTSDRRVCGAGGVKIASCTLHMGGERFRSDAQAAADADLIVRAVNAHDDLVAELKDLRERFHRACLAAGSDPYFVALTTPGADAALAKAGAA